MAKKKRRSRVRWGRVCIALLLVILLVVLCVKVIGGCAKTPEDPVVSAGQVSSTPPESDTPQSQAPVQPVEPDTVLTVLSAGDNLIHSSIYQQANRRAGGNGYDFSYTYANVASVIAAADVATVNQETIISPEHEPSSYPMFNSPVELGEHMIEIGFDIFSLANNHMLDKGESGLENAIEYWGGKGDSIRHTGAYLDEETMWEPDTYTKDGVVFGLVAATQYTNGLYLPEGSDLCYLSTEDTEGIRKKIEATKEVCDVLIVNVHWGNEYTYEPTEGQRWLAQSMADWGADIIIGHHPHVLQPIETVTRADGTEVVVAYSLGNFVSAQDMAPRMVGGLLTYQVTKDAQTGKCTIDQVQLKPVVTHYDANFANNRLYMLEDYTEELANAHGVRVNSPEFSLSYIDELVAQIISPEYLA